MSVIEFIGFIVTFIAAIILFFKQRLEKWRQDADPEYYKKVMQKKKEHLKNYVSALNESTYKSAYHDDDDVDDSFDEEEEESVADEVRLAPMVRKPAVRPGSAVKSSSSSFKSAIPFQSNLEHRKQQSIIDKRYLHNSIDHRYNTASDAHQRYVTRLDVAGAVDPYALQQPEIETRIVTMLNNLDSKKDLIILQEIIGPPKGL